jgi:hypothetical protein
LALPFGQATPDAVPFAVFDGVVQALVAYLAGDADAFRCVAGVAPVGEEQFRVYFDAAGVELPGQFVLPG